MTSRRGHTKSRNGCTNCKQKKIKCDEVYPCCFHCRRQNITCSLSTNQPRATATRTSQAGSYLTTPLTSTSSVSSTSPVSSEAASANGPSENSSSSLQWQSNLSRLGDALTLHRIDPFSTASSPADNSGNDGQTTPSFLWHREAELMHHYCTVTVDSLTPRLDMRQVWRTSVPQFGYVHSYVMHGLLAVAATHKALLVPSQTHVYAAISAHHQVLGSKAFRAVIPNINLDNWRPVFCFTMIVVLHLMGLPSRCKDRKLETPIQSFVDVLYALRGIRPCSEPFHKLIVGSELEPIITGNRILSGNADLPSTIPPLDNSILAANTFQALRLLRDFVAGSFHAEAQHYVSAIDDLELLTKRIAISSVTVEPGPLFAWSWIIDETIVKDLQAMRPLALLLASYFSGILVSFETTYWYVQGWSKGIVSEAAEHLASSPEFTDLMFWPKQQVAHSWG